MKKCAVHILLAAAFVLVCVNFASADGILSRDKTPAVSLKSIVKNPKAYLGTTVKLNCQFESFGRFFNPFFTEFVQDRFLNICAWDDDKNLWVKKDYMDVFCFLYAAKNCKSINEILKFKRFQRFEAKGIVSSCFNNIPWIEITEVKIHKEQVTKESLKRIATGMKLVDEELFSSAYSELSLLENDDTLPERIKMVVAKHQGISAYHTQNYQKARALLQKAYNYFPKDKGLEEYLEKAIRAAALTGS